MFVLDRFEFIFAASLLVNQLLLILLPQLLKSLQIGRIHSLQNFVQIGEIQVEQSLQELLGCCVHIGVIFIGQPDNLLENQLDDSDTYILRELLDFFSRRL